MTHHFVCFLHGMWGGGEQVIQHEKQTGLVHHVPPDYWHQSSWASSEKRYSLRSIKKKKKKELSLFCFLRDTPLVVFKMRFFADGPQLQTTLSKDNRVKLHFFADGPQLQTTLSILRDWTLASCCLCWEWCVKLAASGSSAGFKATDIEEQKKPGQSV